MKDVYTLFNEALAELRKSPAKEKLFRSRAPLGVKTPEALLNCANDVLAGRITESTPITKHNGRGDNELFIESAPEDMTEVAAKNKVAIGSYTCMGISEAHARKILNLAPAEIEALGRHAVADYLSNVRCGINEADATRLAKAGR